MSEVKKIICTNPKNYKLTKNKVYEVITKKNKFYLLKNDSGLPLLYSEELFEEYQEDSIIKEQFLENLKQREGYFTVTISGSETECISVPFRRSRSQISCGIREIEGINNIKSYAIALIRKVNPGYVNDIEFVKNVMTKMIKWAIDSQSGALILLSTNTNHEDNSDTNSDFELLDDIINEFASEGKVIFNPNSSNYIKLWTIIVDNTGHEDYFEIDN